MNAQAKIQLRSAKGSVTLGRELGRGGEGAVYEVDGRPAEVAKVYLKPIGDQQVRKLLAMPAMATPRIIETTAWPTDTLRDTRGTAVGFLMPKAVGSKEIHQLYGPKSRRAEFPTADWRFLVRVAANSAKAMAVVHETGAVIGDFNERGVVVSDKALVRLIDCDSFQISAGGTVYACNVGTPQFTAPELQGRPYRGLVRTPDHDNFALAVLVFNLLFLGRHPFSGRYLVPGDMPLEQAIKEHRFAYGAGRGALRMEPPPGVPPLETCTPTVARLFERAFGPLSPGASRPAARDWAGALEVLEKGARTCAANPTHHYPSGLTACPWCQVESKMGIPLFGFQAFSVNVGGSRFDLALVWGAIAAVPSPGPPPTLLEPSKVTGLSPAPEAAAAKSAGTVIVVCAIIGIIVMTAAVPTGIILWLLIGGVIAMFGHNSGDPNIAAQMRQRLQAASGDYTTLRARWDREASEARFSTRLSELGNDRARLTELPALRLRRVKELEDGRQKAQLRRFLEAHRVDRASIAGVGAGRKTTLTSFGVETAWDVTKSAVMAVPGFGPSLTSKMMTWRWEVERGFRFDPSRGVDPKDIAAIDRDLADQRRVLENSLANGANHLGKIRAEIVTLRQALAPALDAASRRVAQATVDMKAAGG